MMTQKNKLLRIEHEFNLDMAISYIDDNHKKDLDDYLRIIFILMDFLSNRQYTEDEYHLIRNMIKDFFLYTKLKYSHNPEYLFYIGFIASMSEWYFGIEWNDVESMLKKAMYLAPENLLYKWGYCCIPDQRAEVNTEIKHSLSMQILKSNMLMEKIAQKGLLGECLKGFIHSMYESTKISL
jgi:hypothetical protein